ncbi:pleckstrin homology-like domain family B member 3 isoform X2 [Rissa tridactyla]|uniref:pleckstrin homology-like domain family B member 3 isoform X2 n=1 Tax=Rissa tridactyla TaxID=75485 RepID=UPI0023BB1170|nr:pleckstrin homology-like domain family B member 3 isoform X2 [Rissa tridactyla]
MVHRDGGGDPPREGAESDGPPDPTALELQGLSLEEPPHGSRDPQVREPPAAAAAVTSETMTSEAAVTSGGQLMFAHRTDRRWILVGQRDAPCILALRSSVQGAIGLQRAGSLPRRRGERGGSPPQPPPPLPPRAGCCGSAAGPRVLQHLPPAGRAAAPGAGGHG